jgi:hypothetical protein
MSSDDSVPKTRTVTKPQARVVAPPPTDLGEGDATVISRAAPTQRRRLRRPTAGNNLPVAPRSASSS